MIGLIALFILGGWIFLSLFLARRIPRWLGIQRYTCSASAACFLLLLIAPFIQDIVGMWQFDRLCKERAVVWVSPEAGQVKRAMHADLPNVARLGYWIPIHSQPIAYIDVDTGKPFLTYEALHTKGGLIGQLLLLGGTHSCWPKNATQVTNELNTDLLIKQGKTK